MTTNVLELIVVSVWYSYSGLLTAYQLSIFCFIFVAMSISVFIVEMRVRKNDMAEMLSRGAKMSAQIEQKKTYLRYVAHEIRTPLNR